MTATIDTLNRIVSILANQMPVRYYLDARGDGSYSHMRIELYYNYSDNQSALDKELRAYGFNLTENVRVVGKEYIVQTWETERDWGNTSLVSDQRFLSTWLHVRDKHY